MFDRWKKWKIAGSLVIVAAIVIFMAVNVKIRSVDAYKKEQDNRITNEIVIQTQNSEQNDTQTEAGSADKQVVITVKLEITCAAAAKIRDTIKNPGLRDKIPESGVILEKTAYSVPEGCSVYELLSGAAAASHISITASADKSYITSINSLSQMMLSQQSGWKYSINGKIPGQAANKYVLHDGDEVEWFYVLSANEREEKGR